MSPDQPFGQAAPPHTGQPTHDTAPMDARRALALALSAAGPLSDPLELPSGGLAWPRHPDGGEPDPTFYYGTAGIVPLLLDLARATGDKTWTSRALRGGAYLAALPLQDLEPGLVRGVAGVGHTLALLAQQTGEDTFRRAALAGGDELLRRATPDNDRDNGTGLHWQGWTDLDGGTAGIGLALTRISALDGGERHLDTASRAAAWLLRHSHDDGRGTTYWDAGTWVPPQGVHADAHRRGKLIFPNLVHGTAGIGYFLALLYERTGDSAYIRVAEQAAGHLWRLLTAEPTGLVHHQRDDGESLYYLGHCHGPAGTGRFFATLARRSPDPRWPAAVRLGADALTSRPLAPGSEAGLWVNYGNCCGLAGIGDFLLHAHRESGNPGHLAAAVKLATIIETHRTDGGWPHAEHRRLPGQVRAFLGWDQGTAGIAGFLLHLRTVLAGTPRSVSTPFNAWEHPAGAPRP
ncbi:lanthionine synthetase LanC family protein [Nonomuraea sp. NPDC046802]|uniref:lanthionine synthetase LanC family protein n=1 Tax=Nonomuraea sp. NPDC046802 TaxID=3154919 RepID=UPI0033C7D12B